MHKKFIALGLAALLFVLSFPAEAQQAKNVFRIGYLSGSDRVTDFATAEGIRRSLRELGYTEGQNIAVEYRYAEGKLDRLPALASDLVRLKVDIIVTGGDPPIRAAKNATKTIPIVMTGPGGDPVEGGLIKSLARPGGNVTGITNLTGELGGKRLELLKEAIPKLVRVAVLYDLNIPVSVLAAKEVEALAPALKLTVHLWEVRGVDDFDTVFAANKHPDGVYVAASPLFRINRKRIIDFASKSRLPSMYTRSDFVDAGGLMSYASDLTHSYRRVAYFVDKILKGAKPGDLPLEQPTKFELVINLKTAKQIGLTIPSHVLLRADKIIK